jgi:acetyl esterase/lipase
MLVHNNLGAFFASKSILTVIPDYRLVPSVVFPEGSQDIHDALAWVIQNLPEGDPNHLFILAHSAGGVHVSSLLLTPSMFSLPLTRAIRGVILLGVPYDLSNKRKPDSRVAAELYYGDAKAVARNQPLGLLRRADPSYVATLPPIRNLRAGSEPRVISTAIRAFTEAFRNKGGVIEEFVLEGHDHLSPVLALCSGTGEEWGNDVVDWILSK